MIRVCLHLKSVFNTYVGDWRDNDGAIVEPTQLTEPRSDRPQCSILEN